MVMVKLKVRRVESREFQIGNPKSNPHFQFSNRVIEVIQGQGEWMGILKFDEKNNEK
jgi:hypothetical protein